VRTRPELDRSLSRGVSAWKALVVLLGVGCAVVLGLAQVTANSLSKQQQRGEAEVRKSLPQLVALEKESRAERAMAVSFAELGFRPEPDSVYRYSSTSVVLPTRHRVDVVFRAVRSEEGPLRGDAWETDPAGKLVHVVDRSSEATMFGVLRSWLGRSRDDTLAVGVATPEGAAVDRKKREPSTSEARRDEVRWIEFYIPEVDKLCCMAVGKDADLSCLSPLRALVGLQNRSYRIHAKAAETFPNCPGALALALSDEPQSLVDPISVAAAALGGSDPVRRAAGARLFAHLRDTMSKEPTSGLAALAPALSATDMALFGPAATAVASVEDRARRVAGGCRLADCAPVLEKRNDDEARPLLLAVEGVVPSVRETAPRLLRPLVACTADASCTERVGAAWALGYAGRPGRPAADALVSCLGAPPDGPLRGVAGRSLVRLGSDDESVVAGVREATQKAPESETRDAMLGVLVRYPSARSYACDALAKQAIAHIESVRNGAIAVLGRAGHACGETAVSFAPYLKKGSRYPQQESIRLLGLLGPSGKPYLLEMLSVPDLSEFTRRDLERALERADRPDPPDAL